MTKLDKYLSLLQEHLGPGEEVDSAVLGTYETKRWRRYTTRSGVLAATNHRLIAFGLKPRGFEMRMYLYPEIRSVNVTKSFFAKNISIDSGYDHWVLFWVEAGDVPGLVELIRARIASGASGLSGAAELEKLAKLKQQGLLSEEEWDRAAKLYLGKPVSKQEEMISQIRRLDSLRKDGLLSDSEYNSKKWDLLSRNQ